MEELPHILIAKVKNAFHHQSKFRSHMLNKWATLPAVDYCSLLCNFSIPVSYDSVFVSPVLEKNERLITKHLVFFLPVSTPKIPETKNCKI